MGQLVRASVALVYLLYEVRVVLRSVGRGSVVQRAAGSVDVHLAVYQVVPDGVEVLLQLCLAVLYVQVGHSGVQVISPDGVPHGVVLLAERYAVLVVVGAVLHAVAYVYELL